MFCKKCGAHIPDGAQSCSNCGTPVNQTQNYAPVANYPQNNGYQTYNNYNTGRVLEPRSFWLALLLSFLTCGIYLYYWIYTLTEDVNTLSNDQNATGGGMVILLTFLTCGIYLYYWMYKQGDRIDNAKMMRGMPADGNTGVMYLLLTFFSAGIVSYCLMQHEINKMISGN